MTGLWALVGQAAGVGVALGGPPPGAYIKDAERLVDLKTAEYMAWLGQAA